MLNVCVVPLTCIGARNTSCEGSTSMPPTSGAHGIEPSETAMMPMSVVGDPHNDT